MTTSTSERPDTGPGDRYSTRDVNSMPPLRRAIPLGIQHVLAMFVSNVTVPIIIAGAANLPPDQTAFMVQAAMFVAGIATLLQSLGLGPIGARGARQSCRPATSTPTRERGAPWSSYSTRHANAWRPRAARGCSQGREKA